MVDAELAVGRFEKLSDFAAVDAVAVAGAIEGSILRLDPPVSG
jgi:hypothetical protein